MAVNEMKKLSAAVAKKDARRLMSALQKLSCVEITSIPEDEYLTSPDNASMIADINADLSACKRAIEFLTPFDTAKHSMFTPPVTASVDGYDEGLDEIVLGFVRQANELNLRLASLKTESADNMSQIDALAVWCKTGIPIPVFETAHTVTLSGTIPQNMATEALEEKLGDLAELQFIDYSGKGQRPLCVTMHKDDADTVKRILSSFGFSKCVVTATESDGYADGVTVKKKKQAETLSKAIKEAEKEAVVLAGKLDDIKSLHDVLLTRLSRENATQYTAETKTTVLFYAWVPESALPKTENLLCKFDAAYEISDPTEEDTVPVCLTNNAYSKNFEPVLSMYSLPKYGAFDPTTVMSIFYAAIFGMMFADAGYGLLLFLGCLLGKRLLHPKEGLKRMMTMFEYCSIASIIGGVLFGGYFGDLPNSLRENFGGATNLKSPALVFDMIEEPMTFLVLALAIGAIHMITGMVIKLIILWKDGHPLDAIFDVGSWLLLFAGAGVFFLSSAVGKVMVITAVAMLILTQGRHEKNPLMKLAKGLLSLYDIVSYASDLLSYSRILALGLASAVIANVVNLLGTMVGPTAGGIILFVIVFIIGHLINFAVNILGTYVHTSRLQYIEFFGKFFDDGGKEFTPLSYDSKYVNLK